jgi:NADPH-dependent glutamate synthase beta subunit-like oxidoreductase
LRKGRFTDAYMVNRHSNVFPGILGRVCDRPCEPACRAAASRKKPVAICRLKRVAADHRDDDIRSRLPKIPKLKNGKKVALIGAGCASLTVANDLMPLGYSVTIFEQFACPGGLMRTNIPSFRLPAEVLNDEIAQIVEMGVELKLNHPIKSMKELLTKGGFDAVFVGAGAPKGKELKLPAALKAAPTSISASPGLESVAFGHIKAIGEKVLIIGVGNTAMDCCRTSLRLGAKDVKVMARKPRQFFKASAWELEDAEGRTRQDHHQPLAEEFRGRERQVEGNDLRRPRIRPRRQGRDHRERNVGEEFIGGRRRDPRHRAGKTPSRGSSAISASSSTNGMCPKVDVKTFESSRAGVFFGGDAGVRPEEHHLGRGARTPGGDLHPQSLPVEERRGTLAARREPSSTKMGMHEWAYANDYNPAERRLMPHVSLKERFKKLDIEVELGFTSSRSRKRYSAASTATCKTVFETEALHRVRRVHRHLSGRLLDDHGERRGGRPARPAQGAREECHSGLVRIVGAETHRSRHGQRRRPVRALRPLRGALPHCGLGHAEVQDPSGRTPWTKRRQARRNFPLLLEERAPEMPERVNNFAIKIATVNGTGSASANSLLMKSIFRSGVPVMGKNYFPVEHPGSADLVRKSASRKIRTSRVRGKSTSWSR